MPRTNNTAMRPKFGRLLEDLRSAAEDMNLGSLTLSSPLLFSFTFHADAEDLFGRFGCITQMSLPIFLRPRPMEQR